MNPRYLSQLTLLGACLLLLGCGGPDTSGRQRVYPVTGKVTMSGGPLAGASVSFAPREGQPVAVGRTNDQGEYTLTTYDAGDGAAAGQFSVVISKSTAPAASGDDTGHSDDPYVEVASSHSAGAKSEAGGGVPEQYTRSDTTPLNATVSADGTNRFDFEL
jgi:hypothetical protein